MRVINSCCIVERVGRTQQEERKLKKLDYEKSTYRKDPCFSELAVVFVHLRVEAKLVGGKEAKPTDQ